jgi:hypothetical protein
MPRCEHKIAIRRISLIFFYAIFCSSFFFFCFLSSWYRRYFWIFRFDIFKNFDSVCWLYFKICTLWFYINFRRRNTKRKNLVNLAVSIVYHSIWFSKNIAPTKREKCAKFSNALKRKAINHFKIFLSHSTVGNNLQIFDRKLNTIISDESRNHDTTIHSKSDVKIKINEVVDLNLIT